MMLLYDIMHAACAIVETPRGGAEHHIYNICTCTCSMCTCHVHCTHTYRIHGIAYMTYIHT